jgi:cell wall-associated NlpC family hydrolase
MTPQELPADRVRTRREIIMAARAWIGTPYKHQGRGRSGLDCVGLMIEVGDAVGYHVDAPRAYSAMPQGWQLVYPCEKHLWKPEDQTKVIPGDIAVFTGWSNTEPQHFAIIGNSPHGVTLIHSFSKFDKVLEMPWNRVWEKKFFARYVIPGTEEAFV